MKMSEIVNEYVLAGKYREMLSQMIENVPEDGKVSINRDDAFSIEMLLLSYINVINEMEVKI